MTSLRLPLDIEQKISSFAASRNQSKSAVIVAALEQFFKHEEDEMDSYTLGESYFGRYGSCDLTQEIPADSGVVKTCAIENDYMYVAEAAPPPYRVNLSTEYKKLVRDKIGDKYRPR
ncbi:hypothetical protein FACS1894190_01350 [Spirochaetia bacterium]|nr:hypothetical protein FACS1894190_01350 [Spirochaetia bacterium]